MLDYSRYFAAAFLSTASLAGSYSSSNRIVVVIDLVGIMSVIF